MNFKKALLILFSLFFFSSQIFAKEVKFAFLTDISLNNSNSDYLKETIKELNEMKDVDFVVFGGNNLDSAKFQYLKTFLGIVKNLNKKAYVLMGSNDLYANDGMDKDLYLLKTSKALKNHSKKPNYVFKKNDYIFVVMDGAKQYFKSSNGYYSTAELKWLDKTLTKYKNDNVIILQHFPITLSKSMWLQTAKVEEYIDVLRKHNNVKVMVSGHYDTNLEEKFGNINVILTENYSKNHAYKIIELDLENDYLGTFLVK